ncbi:MAG: hypothetical protein LDL41_18460 [Coleofasciculus sp. S288]|nr:hypothetical protein [Coleofasciculus sp. S288]
MSWSNRLEVAPFATQNPQFSLSSRRRTSLAFGNGFAERQAASRLRLYSRDF